MTADPAAAHTAEIYSFALERGRRAAFQPNPGELAHWMDPEGKLFIVASPPSGEAPMVYVYDAYAYIRELQDQLAEARAAKCSALYQHRPLTRNGQITRCSRCGTRNPQ